MAVQPAPQGQPTNTLAIVSLAAGISGFLVFHGIGPLVAIISGHMARGQIRRTGEGGKQLATIGLILGYVYFGIALLIAAFFLALLTYFSLFSYSHSH